MDRKAEYKDGMKLDKKCTMLRATQRSVCISTIKVDGKPYYDGGIVDPIPTIRRSIEDGNDKNLIVLTRPEGYRKELSKMLKSCGKTSQEKNIHIYRNCC